MRSFLLSLVAIIVIGSAWPSAVEAAAFFFYNAPRTYSRPYNQPYYGGVSPYYGRSYSPYSDPRVYSDPRSTLRTLEFQNRNFSPDYYQRYENWWQK
jgi:hypothetical protein